MAGVRVYWIHGVHLTPVPGPKRVFTPARLRPGACLWKAAPSKSRPSAGRGHRGIQVLPGRVWVPQLVRSLIGQCAFLVRSQQVSRVGGSVPGLPAPRLGTGVPSWRPDAVAELTQQWTGKDPLTVLSPELRDGVRAAPYADQVDWRPTPARLPTRSGSGSRATCYTCPASPPTWSPPGRGYREGRPGCPPHCPNPERNRYPIAVARRHSTPVCETLAETVRAALPPIDAFCPYR